jgi:hypothetical protein
VIAVEDRSDDVADLLAALRLPDVPPDPGLLCALDGYISPRLVLLDGQGRWVRPSIPRDSCGKPLAEATTAMDKLRWTRVTTRRSSQPAPPRADAIDGRKVPHLTGEDQHRAIIEALGLPTRALSTAYRHCDLTDFPTAVVLE